MAEKLVTLLDRMCLLHEEASVDDCDRSSSSSFLYMTKSTRTSAWVGPMFIPLLALLQVPACIQKTHKAMTSPSPSNITLELEDDGALDSGMLWTLFFSASRGSSSILDFVSAANMVQQRRKHIHVSDDLFLALRVA